ncbi:MAG: hypothetical protein AAF557_16760 [Pseudomonadota bacterium]
MRKVNSVVRVSYAGGLLGLIAGNARGKIEKVIVQQNTDGWNVAEVIEDSPNLLIWVLRLLLLICTLGLWTLGSSQLIIFEKPA